MANTSLRTDEELITHYLEGNTLDRTATYSGRCRTSVVRTLRKYHVPVRGNYKINVGEAVRLYHDAGLTLQDVATKFNVTPGAVRYILQREGRPSRPCDVANARMSANVRRSCSLRGIEESQWDGFLTPRNRLLRLSEGYSQWRRSVLRRDKTCKVCSKKTGRHVHHIVPFSVYPILATRIENGITLCKDCHDSVCRRELESADDFNALLHEHYGSPKWNKCGTCNQESASLSLVPDVHVCRVCEGMLP